MMIDKKQLAKLIDKKLELIREELGHQGKSLEVKVYQEHGYHTLQINQKPILSVEGLEAFFYALIGFQHGMNFVWYDL